MAAKKTPKKLSIEDVLDDTPPDLKGDWDAVRKVIDRVPKAKAKGNDYPEIADDWAALKNLPKYAYFLEYSEEYGYALHRFKVVGRARAREAMEEDDLARGFKPEMMYHLVARRALHTPPEWKRNERTPSAGWFHRREISFTRHGINRQRQRYTEMRLRVIQQQMGRLVYEISEVSRRFESMAHVAKHIVGNGDLDARIMFLPGKIER